MATDNPEGQEVDLLIRELSSSPRKPVVPKPAAPVAPPALPAFPPDTPQFDVSAPNPPITPARNRPAFVSAISLPALPNISRAPEQRGAAATLNSFVSAISLPSLPGMSWISAPGETVAVWLWVVLGVSLCFAMPYWPYPKGCSWWLLLYLLAVAMVLVAGIWTVRLTWDARLGFAHSLAVGIVLWGMTLAAAETLPRIGYAKAEAVWLCP